MCIWLINYNSGDIVNHSIIYLFGFDNSYDEIIIAANGDTKLEWPVINGFFKIFVELHEGVNIIQLSTTKSHLSFTLIYQSIITENFIQLVYLTSVNENDSLFEHIPRFVYMTKIIQCVLNEILYKQTGYRRTFQIETTNKIQCHCVKLINKKDFYMKMNGEDLYRQIYLESNNVISNRNKSRVIALLSFLTDINDEFKMNETSGTCAFAYDTFTVISIPYFINWPKSLNDFWNILNVKSNHFFYSVGVYLHELCHLYSVQHGDNDNIMSQGFSAAQNFFLVTEQMLTIMLNGQCSCYHMSLTRLSAKLLYENGKTHRIHENYYECIYNYCRFPIVFLKNRSKPSQCYCNGRFQFQIDHCDLLLKQL
ncbi:unnamed protein product [Didymodactylos carnosus]|uniref:Uncharacterized protein n=2 Tax=Didymodactylos carnosus TaxID=1234261 RepID=A0A813TBK5_9BILA|nr:unnamed protein product [Didymodactylos carnosus]CAF3598013.1 unnamed protein product [Didymodactylos carnosus]